MTVQVAGTGLGALTDAQGRYAIRRIPAGTYYRLDVRVSREWRMRRSTLRAYLDVFNLTNRHNPRGYEYNLRIQGGRLVITTLPDDQLGLLPSLGLTWEF